MKKLLICCLICLLFPMLSLAEEVDSEVLILSAPVSDEPPYQGEVRLIRRDSTLVVQTVLNSKVLRHVVAAIQKKEFKAWPEDRDGWLDSRRYTDELFLVYEILQTRAKGRLADDRYLKLLIEFVLKGRRGYVAFYEPTLTHDGDHLVVEEKEMLKKFKISRIYAFENILAIAQDSFKLNSSEVLELMRSIPEEH
jgi:hypothetical protein